MLQHFVTVLCAIWQIIRQFCLNNCIRLFKQMPCLVHAGHFKLWACKFRFDLNMNSGPIPRPNSGQPFQRIVVLLCCSCVWCCHCMCVSVWTDSSNCVAKCTRQKQVNRVLFILYTYFLTYFFSTLVSNL